MKVNDALAGALLGALAIGILLYTRSFPAIHGQVFGPRVFPNSIATVLLVCAGLLVVRGWKARDAEPWLARPAWLGSPRHVAAFATVIAVVIAYITLANSVGFLIVGSLSLLALFLVMRVRPALALVMAVVATAVIWYAFYKLLRVPLPWGVLQRFAF